jgi:hypothetical protein
VFENWKAQPNERIATAEEVANLALFLGSGEVSFITGCDYPIDGGSSICGVRRLMAAQEEERGADLSPGKNAASFVQRRVMSLLSAARLRRYERRQNKIQGTAHYYLDY